MNHVLSVHDADLPGLRYPAPGRHDWPGAMVGHTPVLWIAAPFTSRDCGFWAKLEGFNPGGMKDRPALHMVERARARADLRSHARIIESTSGTLGLGLALAGTVYKHPVTLVTDPGMEPIVARMLRAYGADIEVVSEPHPTGGWQQARRDRVSEILAADPHAWYPDQYNNPDNIDAYQPLALELIAQLERVDVLVCSVGTGGHSAGVARVLRQFNPDLRLIGVDTIGSTIFGQPAMPRLMPGAGVQHLSPQCGLFGIQRGALGRCGGSGVGLPKTGGQPLCQRRVERRRGRACRRLGSADTAGAHDHRRGVSRRPAALFRHHIQRRLLPRT